MMRRQLVRRNTPAEAGGVGAVAANLRRIGIVGGRAGLKWGSERRTLRTCDSDCVTPTDQVESVAVAEAPADSRRLPPVTASDFACAGGGQLVREWVTSTPAPAGATVSG